MKIVHTMRIAVIAAVSLFMAANVPMGASARDAGTQGSGSILAQTELKHVHRGNSDKQGECFNVPVMHEHHGNETEGGECYSPVYHVHSDACNPTYRTEHFTCRGWRNMGNKLPIYCKYHGDQESWQYEITWQCNETGEIVKTQQWTGCAPCHNCDPDSTPWERTAGPFYNCGKDESTIDSYSLACSKTPGETVDSYDPGCGLEEGISYGSISIINNTGWTSGNVSVSAVVESSESKMSDAVSQDCVFSKEDGTVISGSGRNAEISENGSYKAVIASDPGYTENGEYTLNFTVTNIDRTAPLIDSVTKDESKYCQGNLVTITASDKQPDGTAGSGSSIMKYSFDGGNTYGDSSSVEIKENGTYHLCVKDECGNVSDCKMIGISNIDHDGPEYTIEKPDTWHEGDGSITIKIAASDNGAGLSDKPYSFDGGKTWTDNPEIVVDTPESVDIKVRDAVGNETGEMLDIGYSKIKDDGNGSGNGSGGGAAGGSSDSTVDDKMLDDLAAKKDKEKKKKEDIVPAAVSGSGTNSGTSEGEDDSDNEDASKKKKGQSSDDNTAWADMPVSETEMETEVVIVPANSNKPMSAAKAKPWNISKAPAAAAVPFFSRSEVKAAAASTGVVMAIVLFIFAGWVMYRGVRIYNFDNKKYRYMGLALISSGMHGFEITVENHIREEAYTERYMFKPFKPFLKRHKNDNLVVKMGDSRFTRVLAKCINLELREL